MRQSVDFEPGCSHRCWQLGVFSKDRHVGCCLAVRLGTTYEDDNTESIGTYGPLEAPGKFRETTSGPVTALLFWPESL